MYHREYEQYLYYQRQLALDELRRAEERKEE